MADRIKHTNIFIERAKKRVHALQDVKMAQAAVVVAQEKLAKEEVLLREGEGRLQALQQEGQRDGLPGGPTHRPVQFCRRIDSVESMCARVADGTGRLPRQVAEFR